MKTVRQKQRPRKLRGASSAKNKEAPTATGKLSRGQREQNGSGRKRMGNVANPLIFARKNRSMNPFEIIDKYYAKGTEVSRILIRHSEDVASKALRIARLHPEMNLGLRFIEEAAMLHDIGIFLCHAPEIGCHGEAGYICHGYLGANLMREEGYPLHALVCERHTGAGITLGEIQSRNLPLPHRDMLPLSREEQLICYADKFFSKNHPGIEKPVEKIKKSLSKHGEGPLLRFSLLHSLFGE